MQKTVTTLHRLHFLLVDNSVSRLVEGIGSLKHILDIFNVFFGELLARVSSSRATLPDGEFLVQLGDHVRDVGGHDVSLQLDGVDVTVAPLANLLQFLDDVFTRAVVAVVVARSP